MEKWGRRNSSLTQTLFSLSQMRLLSPSEISGLFKPCTRGVFLSPTPVAFTVLHPTSKIGSRISLGRADWLVGTVAFAVCHILFILLQVTPQHRMHHCGVEVAMAARNTVARHSSTWNGPAENKNKLHNPHQFAVQSGRGNRFKKTLYGG